jgi:hypothetical protein
MNANYECDTTGILIDTLVVHLTNQVDDGDDIGVMVSIAGYKTHISSTLQANLKLYYPMKMLHSIELKQNGRIENLSFLSLILIIGSIICFFSTCITTLCFRG